MDTDDYIAAMKTMDPLLAQGLGSSFNLEDLKPFIPTYKGMRHPPPKTGSPECDKPWSAPFLSNYTAGRGRRLRLTMCNWYLPQGPGVPAIYRSAQHREYNGTAGTMSDAVSTAVAASEGLWLGRSDASQSVAAQPHGCK